MTIEIVMIKEAEEADRHRPVRVSRRQRSFQIKRMAVLPVHTDVLSWD